MQVPSRRGPPPFGAEPPIQIIGRSTLPNLTILPVLTAPSDPLREAIGAGRPLPPSLFPLPSPSLVSPFSTRLRLISVERPAHTGQLACIRGATPPSFNACSTAGPPAMRVARTELLERAAQRLLILTRRMFRNYPQLRRWEETDDVFQNAILRLYRSLGDVRPDSVRGFFAPAATQIRRTLIDLARHHFGPEGSAAHHHSETRAAQSGSNSHDSRLAGGDEPPETLDAWARFHEAVEHLPLDERDAFSLVWYGEATQHEVADLLGVSERTVLRRLVRARLLLHESLKNTRTAFEEANGR